MNIISTTITRRAEEQNANALYHIDYSITDDILERVVATVYRPADTLTGEAEAPIFVGTLTYENGQVFCALPGDSSFTELMNDFEQFLTQIKTAVQEETEDKKN